MSKGSHKNFKFADNCEHCVYSELGQTWAKISYEPEILQINNAQEKTLLLIWFIRASVSVWGKAS